MTIPDRFCVYTYYDESGIFYVGEGNTKRPFLLKKSRSLELAERLKTSNFNILILKENISKTEAIDLEQRVIENYKTKYSLLNIQQTRKSHEHLLFDFCNKHWYISDKSKTGIKWKEFDKKASFKIIPHKDAGVVNDRGYCSVKFKNIQHQCHRIVWVLFNKRALSADLVVNHIDSNPLNNNPNNLIAVTQSQNTFLKDDRYTEGRNATGLAGIIRDTRSASWIARGRLNDREWVKYFNDHKHANSLQAAIDYRNEMTDIRNKQRIELILKIQETERILRNENSN